MPAPSNLLSAAASLLKRVFHLGILVTSSSVEILRTSLIVILVSLLVVLLIVFFIVLIVATLGGTVATSARIPGPTADGQTIRNIRNCL